MTPVSLARIPAAVALAAIVASGPSFDARAIRAAAGEAAASQASRAPRNADEFDALFQQVKNWGRWGADDQLGAANLVTAATRKRAVALAKDGSRFRSRTIRSPTRLTTTPARSSTR